MHVKRPPVWAILIILAMTAMAGCSGGGSSTGSVVSTSTPESAVYEILAAWQKSQTSVVSSANEGTLVEQETTDESYIRFRDMSGEEWLLRIDEIIYLSPSNALVHTSYHSSYASRGSLRLVFAMYKETTGWYLNDIEITEVPVVVVTETGVSGIVTDSVSGLPVSAALVELYDQTTGAFISGISTNEAGFYSFTDLVPGSYYMVIDRAGYEPQTISEIIIG